jgi:hypothetical protein
MQRHGRFCFFDLKSVLDERLGGTTCLVFLHKRLDITNRMMPVSYVVMTAAKDSKRFGTSDVRGLFEKKTRPDV